MSAVCICCITNSRFCTSVLVRVRQQELEIDCCRRDFNRLFSCPLQNHLRRGFSTVVEEDEGILRWRDQGVFAREFHRTRARAAAARILNTPQHRRQISRPQLRTHAQRGHETRTQNTISPLVDNILPTSDFLRDDSCCLVGNNDLPNAWTSAHLLVSPPQHRPQLPFATCTRCSSMRSIKCSSI